MLQSRRCSPMLTFELQSEYVTCSRRHGHGAAHCLQYDSSRCFAPLNRGRRQPWDTWRPVVSKPSRGPFLASERGKSPEIQTLTGGSWLGALVGHIEGSLSSNSGLVTRKTR